MDIDVNILGIIYKQVGLDISNASISNSRQVIVDVATSLKNP